MGNINVFYVLPSICVGLAAVVSRVVYYFEEFSRFILFDNGRCFSDSGSCIRLDTHSDISHMVGDSLEIVDKAYEYSAVSRRA